MLYDLVTCPHRVAKDLYGDPGERDEVNPFVQLLWEKGTLYEEVVIDGLKLSEEAEAKSFSDAWQYIQSKQPCAIYYYSKYERTIYRKLQAKYPHVCSPEDIENLFNPVTAIDLYFDVVKKKTEWPTNDQSIKTLAKFLGFGWRDTHPSGAASIQWFDEWVKLSDPKMKQRILDYNEDDCRATRWLLDGIRSLSTPAHDESVVDIAV